MLTIARWIVHSFRRWRIEAMHGKCQWRRVPAGFWMYINPNEWHGRTVMMGYYESHLVYCITQLVRKGDVCIDIGANQGYITLHFARAVGANGTVIAIEPIRAIYERLVQNVQRNGFNQVICVNVAAGDRHGTAEIWFNTTETGYSSMYHRSSEACTREIVIIKPVDDVAEETIKNKHKDHIVFSKIDTEGYEPSVLDGMHKLLTQTQPIIWIEVNPPLLAKGGYTVKDIEQRLNKAGYRFFKPSFHRNILGIPSVRLIPCPDLVSLPTHKDTNILAVAPGSAAWERLQASKIRLVKEEHLCQES